jgi:ATP-dependent RNA helicase DeaD
MEKLLPKFAELGLSASTLKALAKKGFEEPSPIQAQVIPVLLAGKKDVIGQAQTGTGKTAAFGLPLIEKLSGGGKSVQALVLVPTRELALQVAEELNSLKGEKSLQIAAIYGGQSMREQLRRLEHGVDIVVGTPGRVIDHLERKSLQLNALKFLVLDEADEMLNMGFIDDVETIIKNANKDKRMLMFSATMAAPLMKIAEKYMGEKEIVAVKKQQLTTNLTTQIYFEVRENDKLEALCRIVDMEEDFYGVVFCRTKVDVDALTRALRDRSYEAEGIHGDIDQNNREKVLKRFRTRDITILIATDVAARGIDINDLTHVINYALPQNPEAYVHRIGRTGRAGKQGTAITFITPSEYRKLVFIQKVTKTEIQKQQVPKAADVVKRKLERLQTQIQQLMQDGAKDSYQKLAKNLLKGQEPEAVVAAVLQHAFQDELNEKSYKEIAETGERRQRSGDSFVDNQGTARLYIARGSDDGMNPQKLTEWIIQLAKTKPHKIQEVQIFDKFSFITVPFAEAEFVIRAFSRPGKDGGRPVVVQHAQQREAKGRTESKPKPGDKKRYK